MEKKEAKLEHNFQEISKINLFAFEFSRLNPGGQEFDLRWGRLLFWNSLSWKNHAVETVVKRGDIKKAQSRNLCVCINWLRDLRLFLHRKQLTVF